MTSAEAAQWPSAMQTPGSLVHSVSLAQARQLFVAVLQIGLVPPQSASARHSTQAPVSAQTGVALGAASPPSLPPPLQSVLAAQARQALLTLSQIGSVPLHEALVHGFA